MVKKITFYDKDEAIQYQLKMRQMGYIVKMIHPEGKYEVVVAGEVPEWKTRPSGGQSFGNASEDSDKAL
jgi:hypothetical protein